MDSLEAVNVRHRVLRVEIVPFLIRWKVDLHWGGASLLSHVRSWLADLWGDKDVATKHELEIEVKSVHILWEFIPHWADDRGTMCGSLEEKVIKVVDLFVSLMDGLSDDVLNARTLEPWLPHWVPLVCMGPEEWEKHS